MKSVDINELTQTADPQLVAEEYGIPMSVKANRVYIECPSHFRVLGKRDGHINNCVLTEHGYHCFSCGTTGNVLKMIADYEGYDYNTFKDKLAVAQELAQRLYPEFLTDYDPKSAPIKTQKIYPFGLKDSDLMYLGLYPTEAEDPRAMRDHKIHHSKLGKARQIPSGDPMIYLYGYVHKVSLVQLYQDEDNREMVDTIILGKAHEQADIISKLMKRHDGSIVLDFLPVEIKNEMFRYVKKVKSVIHAIEDATGLTILPEQVGQHMDTTPQFVL